MDQGMTWGPGDIPGSPELIVGTSYQRVISLAQPSAGHDWTLQCPGGYAWRFLSMHMQLQTSAAVANRRPQFKVLCAGSVIYETESPANQTAGATWDYTMAQALAFNNVQQFAIVHLQFPLGCILQAGDSIVSSTIAMDAADQWLGLQALVREYVIGQQLPFAIYRDIAINP